MKTSKERLKSISKWAKDNPDKRAINSRKYEQKIKYMILYYYSGGSMACNCCGETHIEFLTLDHPNKDGNKHRREVGHVYNWIVKNNFPPGFRVLCMNCNWGSRFGECPHDLERRRFLESLG